MLPKDINRLTLVGTAAAAPAVRQTAGVTIAHVSVATLREWVDRDGTERSRTDWHRVTFRGPDALLAERDIRAGSRIYVEGRIEYGYYDRDGLSIPTADIEAAGLVILK